MRTFIMVVVGLVGGFILGIILGDIGHRLFGAGASAVLNPPLLALIGAIVVPLVDRAVRRRGAS